MMRALEPEQIAAVVSRLATLYEAAGPRLGCALVEANVLLVLADVRGTTNVAPFEPTDADRAVMGHLENTLEGLGLRAWMSEETRNANGRMCCAVVLDSLEGHGFVSTHSQMPWVTPFDPASGWEGWKTWAAQAHARLAAAYPEDSEDVRFARWIGVALGYPDQAIEDLCQHLRAGRSVVDGLVDAPIAGIERYGGAWPNFSLRPEYLSDPSVEETCATWGQLIEAVYASAWHQQLVHDSAFQAARQERDRQRVFLRQ